MPLAWEARLTPKEVSIFKTLYGEARINERIHAQLFRLILGSKATGTITAYVASINQWNSYEEFPPDPLSFSMYITNLSEKPGIPPAHFLAKQLYQLSKSEPQGLADRSPALLLLYEPM